MTQGEEEPFIPLSLQLSDFYERVTFCRDAHFTGVNISGSMKARDGKLIVLARR
jgi:hypothetical protein